MNILVIDSSKKRACIQIITAERTVSYTLDETEKHSENLLKRI